MDCSIFSLCHCDLGPGNILVAGQSIGIIDWEMAGWWPAYWEYIKSLFGNKYEQWWKTLVPEILHPYQHELRIESDLQQF